MTSKVEELSKRLKAFNDEMIALIRSVPDEKWQTRCEDEQWPIGVVARHVGVGHYSVIEFAKMMISGTPFPDFSHSQVDEMNKAHAEKHANCTKEEVLSILEKRGAKLVDYVSGLSDADLAVTADLPGIGDGISVVNLFKGMVIHSGKEHIESMRKALG